MDLQSDNFQIDLSTQIRRAGVERFQSWSNALKSMGFELAGEGWADTWHTSKFSWKGMGSLPLTELKLLQEVHPDLEIDLSKLNPRSRGEQDIYVGEYVEEDDEDEY